MRQLLLDTHVALWAFGAPERLSPAVRGLIIDPKNSVIVSAVSVWEVEIKRAIGKLDAPEGFAGMCTERGFDALDITFRHAEGSGVRRLRSARAGCRLSEPARAGCAKLAG